MKLIASALLAIAVACGAGDTGRRAAADTSAARADWTWRCDTAAVRSPACDSLARRYIDGLVRAASSCDPADPGACSRRFPTGGFGPVDPLICNCAVAVDASRAQEIDAILAEYLANGCTIGCCPCPNAPPEGYRAACVASRGGEGTCR